jgi:hypothetical protein
MVIAWDRRSDVSRNIPRWFHPTPGATPPEPNAHLAATSTRSSTAAHALRQAGPSRPACQRQPKCDPLAAKYQRLAGLQPLSRRRASVDPEADALTARARRAMLGDVIVLMRALRPSRGPSRRIPTRMYVAESIQAWNAAGAVRDFITGCWPTVWCATAGLSWPPPQ